MTHDPLCPARPFDDGTPSKAECRCDLIARVREDERLTMEAPQLYYAKGYAAALSDAVDAVKALPWKVAVTFGPIDCDRSCDDGPCACSGIMRPEAWMTGPDDAVAAIEALKEKP